jgi:hypothetical protein
MTKGTLSIISNAKVVDGATPKLKEKLNIIVEERRQATVESVSKTVVYHVEMGASAIMLDDIPNIINADIPFIEGWMKEQGFEVVKPRFGGRTKVVLHTE